MNITRCELDGVLLIDPQVHVDHRGSFVESWSLRRYLAAGIGPFAQDNFAPSLYGVLRGMHAQRGQGKLCSVLAGVVWDVVTDIRPGSATFGRSAVFVLSGDNGRQVWIPPGFAHGFVVMSETAMFHYKCTKPYRPEDTLAFRWNDPDAAIAWPIINPILSERDANAPPLRDLAA